MVARGQGDDLEARFAKAPNVVDYISKPFSPEALQAVVSHVVGRRTSDSRPGAATRSPTPTTRASAGVARRGRRGAVAVGGLGTVAEARAFAAIGPGAGRRSRRRSR